MDFFWNRANVQNVQEQDQNGLNKQNQSFNDFPNTFFYEFEEVVVMKIIICVEKFPKFSSSRHSAPWLPLCVLFLIRACWVENFENNRCVFDTIIRDIKVFLLFFLCSKESAFYGIWSPESRWICSHVSKVEIIAWSLKS